MNPQVIAAIIVAGTALATAAVSAGISVHQAKKQTEQLNAAERLSSRQADRSRQDVLRQQSFANTIGLRQQLASERANRAAERQAERSTNLQFALGRQQLTEQARQFDVGTEQTAESFDFAKEKWGEEFSHQKEMDKESLALKRQEIRRSNLSTLSQNLLQATATDMSFRNYMSNLYGGRRAA